MAFVFTYLWLFGINVFVIFLCVGQIVVLMVVHR
jgi:hypothetical protein